MTIELSTTLTTFAADAPASWEPTIATAQMYDRVGFDRLVVSDHVVFGERLDEYARPEIGGARGGVQPTGPDGHWLEPLTTLTFIAASTARIRVGTNILIAALRRPVVLAKTAATLDVLSGGRLDLAVGVGWQREEYDAAGLEFDGRGRLLDQTLEVCQTLWRDERAAYDGPGLRFDSIHMMPKPVQPGGVPLWISGTVNQRVARRLARFGSGWVPWGDAAADVVTGIAQMRDALAALGRDPADLKIVGGLPAVRRDDRSVDVDRTVAAVPALVDAGVTDVRARLPLPDDPAAAEELAAAFVAAFREVVG
jgi:probable F420-dependent oxidoreductase